jgi:F0F1-type ATP synthase membrane subunit b/b'
MQNDRTRYDERANTGAPKGRIEETMSTGAIIAVIVGAVLVLALIWAIAHTAGQKRRAARREEARELRTQARSQSAQAEGARASADEQAAQARRSEAEAEELAAKARKDRAAAEQRAMEAERQSEAARSHHDQARQVDPDMSDSGHEEALTIDRD